MEESEEIGLGGRMGYLKDIKAQIVANGDRNAYS